MNECYLPEEYLVGRTPKASAATCG